MDNENKDDSPALETENENRDEAADDNGVSRFSDDGMETEIEVTPDDTVTSDSEKKKRKKKKKKSSLDNDNRNGCDNDVKKEKCETSTFVVIEPQDGGKDQQGKKQSKKKQMKAKLKKMKEDPLYPLYLMLICKVCVLLPISIYACDVLIGVNVLESAEFGIDLVKQERNFFNGSDAPLLSVADHPYKHKFHNTVFFFGQLYLKERRTKRHVGSNSESNSTEPSVESHEMTVAPTMPDIGTSGEMSTDTEETTPTSNTKIPQTPEASTALSNTLTLNTSITTDSDTGTTMWIENATSWYRNDTSTQYCKSDIYFLKAHEELSSKTNTVKEKEYDWYNNMSNLLYSYQQALFFMFTVIGFIFLLTSIGMRVDAIINEKWSSSLLLTFLLYSISMSLTAKVFALQSGSNGVRCFLCRMVSFCTDIDPWDLTTDVYFPTDFNWNTAAFVSIILKIYDCFTIGIVTLKFVVDLEKDVGWVIFLKIVGWMIAFPVMVVMPVAGVMRYSVLPVTAPDLVEAKLAFEIIFYIGVVFWGLALAILPFFCKTRMCNKAESYEEEEEEYY